MASKGNEAGTPLEAAERPVAGEADCGVPCSRDTAESRREAKNRVATLEKQHAYIGPSLPGGRLKKNTIFKGSVESVYEYLADVLSHYPEVKRFIVPVSKLAEQKNLVSGANGTAVYYAALEAKMNNKKEG